eukprot:TRINITY_DN82737_c0_g1_i1.p1 TRINITY_DN82737_c0_g1~~TRINITY_DN82737_c0_g1_i1.p1  ORF type:complete len:758 (+),score=167.52 TRINITY_DN82737_c0_g1_i1:3-2276(+)
MRLLPSHRERRPLFPFLPSISHLPSRLWRRISTPFFFSLESMSGSSMSFDATNSVDESIESALSTLQGPNAPSSFPLLLEKIIRLLQTSSFEEAVVSSCFTILLKSLGKPAQIEENARTMVQSGSLEVVIRAFQRHVLLPEIAILGASILLRVLQLKSMPPQPHIIANGGHEVLIRAIRYHCGREDVHLPCVESVRMLCLGERFADILIHCSLVNVLSSAIRQHLSNLTIVSAILDVFEVVARDIQCRKALVDADNIEILILLARRLMHDERVITVLMKILSNLSKGFNVLTLIVEMKALKILSDIFEYHRLNPVILQHISLTLSRIAAQKQYLSGVLKVVSVGFLVSLVERNIENPRVEGGLLALMGALAREMSVRNKLIQKNAPEMIMRIMKLYPDEEDVIDAANAALRYLSAVPVSHSKFADLGSVALLVKVLERHCNHATIATRACATLRNLAYDPQHQISIVKEGGLKQIFDLMDHHIAVAVVQETGCSALQNLAGNPTNQIEIIKRGGLDRIIAAMRAHPSVPEVQSAACGALRNFAAHPSNKEKIVLDGALDLVLVAMREHTLSSMVQEAAASVLQNLASSMQFQNDLVRDGAIVSLLVDAMRTENAPVSVAEKSIAALRNLAISSQSQAYIMREGGLDLILTFMEDHPHNVQLQRVGCAALRNLAASPTGQKLIGTKRGISVLHRAYEVYPDDDKLAVTICEALWNLSCLPENIKLIQGFGNVVYLSEQCSKLTSVADKLLERLTAKHH